MLYREWKARAAAELARVYKVWPPRIPEHVWRDAYVAGITPEQGATAAQAYDRNSRPVKLMRNQGKLTGEGARGGR